MSNNWQKTTTGSDNYSLGFNYSPITGFGLNLGYSSAPTQTETMTIEQPQITYNQPMGIEGNYPRFDNRSIGAPSSRGNQPLALGAPSSRDHRAYANEGRPSRDHRAYANEGRSSRGNQPLALGAPSSRGHRTNADEGRPSRDHRAYTDEGRSSRGHRTNADEGRPSRDHRAYANEGRPSRGNQPLALGAPSSRDHRAYTNEGRSSRGHRAYADEERSSRGNDSNYRLLAFYRNEIPSEPNGALIETILQDWSGNYDKLDNMNSYIQWIFPTRTPGRNSRAPLLTDEFVREINSSSILRERVQRAFRMILNFYGMQMEDISTIILTNDSSKRLKIIRSDNKYYLVISRILSFLKKIDMVPLMKVWLKFLADLIDQRKLDDKAKESYNEYWINILDQSDKKEIRDYIRQL